MNSAFIPPSPPIGDGVTTSDYPAVTERESILIRRLAVACDEIDRLRAALASRPPCAQCPVYAATLRVIEEEDRLIAQDDCLTDLAARIAGAKREVEKVKGVENA